MAEQTQGSIQIEAPPAAVLEVVADLAAYPRWVDSLESAEVLATGPDGHPERVRMSLRHPALSDTYTLAYTWGVDEVSWHLLEGRRLTAMDGSYLLSAHAGGTEVTYRLSVDLDLPMPGVLRRRAEKAIVDGALKGLRRRVHELSRES